MFYVGLLKVLKFEFLVHCPFVRVCVCVCVYARTQSIVNIVSKCIEKLKF